MKILRRLKVDIVIFLIGMILGASSALYLYFDSAITPDMAREMVTGRFISHWSLKASNALTQEKPEIAVWAMENLIALSERRLAEISDETVEKRLCGNDLVRFYGRLSVVYAALGDEERYRSAIETAIAYSKKYSPAKRVLKSEDEVLRLVKKISKFGPKIASRVLHILPVDPEDL